ncbi:MAG TPA: class I SAM-dependent methyltransferase [Solirubrobacteraceae bacterium]|jgi:2-polyprenyl-3-methyl-5-hydroxy-6-metoxy-1,4-benzoquinol methylase/ribosomal protein S27E|nr:class I SAM-dependent methyltransferase [Solirubrobacteraceae bacterium]
MPAEELREADIRPDALMPEQAQRFAADVAWLLCRRDRFVEVACPACGADTSELAWSKYQLSYERCLTCETVYVNPRPEPELLREYYATSQNYEYWNRVIFPASEAARRDRIFRPRAERLAKLVGRHGVRTGTLVDVGAGFGTFAEEVARLGIFERVIALEPEPHLAETCRSKGLEVVEVSIEDEDIGLDEVDVITSFEVIEHLFSPRTFTERCRSLLSPGGLCLLTCPNVKGFDIVVLGEQANAVDVEHLNYMHPASLARMLAESGLEVLESQTPGRLDAELVRKKVLAGEFDLTGQPFLRQVLIDEWESAGAAFQDYLSANGLSSNMWLLARRPG